MPERAAEGLTIGQLIAGLPIELVRGSASTIITSIVEDSRCASAGSLFVAHTGTQADGCDFVYDAVARGAVAVLRDQSRRARPVPPTVTMLSATDAGRMLGMLAERFHGHPSHALRLTGVTGTNGKTTICHLLHHALCRAGITSGLISTVRIDEGAAPSPAAMTTPPAIEISRRLAAMVANGCAAAVLEVSSHALDQGRTSGLAFDLGVFTNLSGDHLDYHRTFDAYAEAKATLLRGLPRDGWAIVNIDDPAAGRMLRGCAARPLCCSLTDPGADCHARIVDQSIEDVRAAMVGPWGTFELRLPLTGRHNVTNALLASAAAFVLGVDQAALAVAMSTCGAPPGRLERVPVPDDEFTVLVDYAHSDDALANVLQTLRPLVPDGGRLRVVFGCGGDRDQTKRPRMAHVAAGIADEMIITSDNPRTENPQTIIDDIVAGVPASRRRDALIVVSRRQAIERAIERSGRGDVVVIAGKGHEPYQVIGTQKRPFDDRIVAADALRRRVPVAT